MSPKRRRTNGAGLSLAGPFVVLFGVFFVYPLCYSVWLAFQQTFGASHARFVGVGNFVALVSDERFGIAVRNSLVYTAASLFVQLPAALGLALLLNRRGLRGRSVYRLILFSPQIFGLVFAAILGQVFFSKEGVINQVLHSGYSTLRGWLGGVGIELEPVAFLEFAWLGNQPLLVMIIASLWMYVGFNMIFFLAALQNVDEQLVESSMIDGAGAWSRFVHVTLPAIVPVGSFVVLLSVIGSMQLFELPYIMLDEQGAGDKGLFIVSYLFEQGFSAGDLGYASAVGWVLGLALIGASLVQRMLAREGAR